MDCEKFDEHLMDALYGELDELSMAALRRHVDACPRCRAVWDGLESTRRAAVLPLEQPPTGLRDRILAAEQAEQRQAPWHRKLLRGVAWAGSLAMRPQLAMAALFMLVVGSSLLLLRGRHGDLGAPIEVTELGQPSRGNAEEQRPVAAAPMAEAESGAERSKAGRAVREVETTEKRVGGAADDGPADTPLPSSPAAMAAPDAAGKPRSETSDQRKNQLADALTLKSRSGCAGALSQLEAIVTDYPGTDEARTAAREAATCTPASGAAARPAGKPSTSSTASSPPAP